MDGGIYTTLFWGGQVIVGGLLPLILLFTPLFSDSRQAIVLAALSVISGGLAQVYVIIIGGQAFPLVLFPGKLVQSSFADGVVASYSPSLPEIGLGIGGFSMALAIVAVAVKLLALLPQSLADKETDAT